MQNTHSDTRADTGRPARSNAAGHPDESASGAPGGKASPNPSGGRKWTAHHGRALDLADAFAGLKPGEDRFTLVRLLGGVSRAALPARPDRAADAGDPESEVVWTDALVRHFTLLVGYTRPCDWEPGRHPIVWLSVAETARKLGISTGAVRCNEDSLVRLQALAHRDSANCRRFGYRDSNGHIVEAYGVDLGPSAASIPRLAAQAEREANGHAGHLRRKRRLFANQRSCTALAHAALRQNLLSNTAGHALLARIEELREGVDDALPRDRLDERVERSEALQEQLRGLVEGRAPRPEAAAGGGDTSSEPTESVARAPVYCCPGNSPLLPPYDYNTNDSSRNRDSVAEGCRKENVGAAAGAGPAGSGGGSPAAPRASSDTGATRGRAAPRLSFDTVLAIVPPSVGARLPHGRRPSWSELTDAVAAAAGAMGISQDAWGAACHVLGRRGATIAGAVIAVRHAEGRIASPGGYLRAMTERAERGELRLAASVHGILQERKGTPAMKPPPTPPAALDDGAAPASPDPVPTERGGLPASRSTWRENLFASASRTALLRHADAFPPPSFVAPPAAVAGVRRQLLDVVLPALHPPVRARLPHDRPPAVRDVVNAVEDAVGAGDLLVTPLELAALQDDCGPVTAALDVIARTVENRPGGTRHRLALYRRLMRRPWRDAAMAAWDRLDRHIENCHNRSVRRSREGWSRNPPLPLRHINFDSFLDRRPDDPEPARLDETAAEAEYLREARRDGLTMNLQVHTLPTHPRRGGGLRRWLRAVALRLVPPEVGARLPMHGRPSMREIVDAVDAAAAAGEFTMPHSTLKGWSGRFGRAAGTTLFVAVARDNCLGSPEPPFTADPARVRDRHAERELYDTVLFHLPNHFDRHRHRERRGRRAGRGQAPWFETALAIVPPEVRRLFPPGRPPVVADILGAGCHTLWALGLNGLLLGQILGIREAITECFRMAAERQDVIRAWTDRYRVLEREYEEEFRHRKDTRLHGLDDTVVDFPRPDGKEV